MNGQTARLIAWGGAALLITLGAAVQTEAQSPAFKVIAHFNLTNGDIPGGGLVQGLDGNFYGATHWGGTNSGCENSQGCGTIFRVTPTGQITTLYDFCSQQNCSDGSGPNGPLTLGTDGNFYGTTIESFSNDTIFKITPAGKFTVLYTVLGIVDGSSPNPGLVEGPDGNLYGTMVQGGLTKQCGSGCGTVFRITSSGKLTLLYSFTGLGDGAYPSALIRSANGTFYGVTNIGGDQTCKCGTVFEITPQGVLTTVHSFVGTDAAYPSSPLIQATGGNLFGTSTGGGTCGTVFKVTPQGDVTTLHDFGSQSSNDGCFPTAQLVLATDGNFFGTTSGASEEIQVPGTIFRIGGQGNLRTLHTFLSQMDCIAGPCTAPAGGLVQGTDGSFYGTTSAGGDAACQPVGCGYVFNVSTALGPFVRTLPVMGRLGSQVKILGTDLTGATSVTFNGIAANFTVVSPTEIVTSVPTGAASGTVQVATPTGTLNSNATFQVLQ